jgi:hypothetical protein
LETRTTRFGMGSRVAMAKGYLINTGSVDMATPVTGSPRSQIAYAFRYRCG